MRETILEELNILISEFINKASKGARYRYPEADKLRISYANSLANLVRAYTALLRDKELDEIKAEIEELKKWVIEKGSRKN